MTTQNNGGPAFPHPNPDYTQKTHLPFGGMSLRDYFAAKALQGMLACEMLRATEQEFSERAYAVADAMLKARAQ